MVALETADALLTLRWLPPYAARDEADYLAALERIGAEARPFGLVLVFGNGGRLSQAGERAQAVWFKRTRAAMNLRCRGIAMVRPGATEATADVFRRLWTFPIAVAPDEAEARGLVMPVSGGPR